MIFFKWMEDWKRNRKGQKPILSHHLLGAGLVFTLVLWLIASMTTQILRKLWRVRRGWINTHHPPQSALTVAPIELCLCRYVRVRAQPLAIPRHVCQQAFCLTTCWTASSGWLSSLHFIPRQEKKTCHNINMTPFCSTFLLYPLSHQPDPHVASLSGRASPAD